MAGYRQDNKLCFDPYNFRACDKVLRRIKHRYLHLSTHLPCPLFLAADLGLNGYVLPRLSKRYNEANSLFNFRLIWSVFLLFLSNMLVFLLPFKNQAFNDSVFLGSLSIVFSGVFNSSNLIFQSKLRYDKSVLSQITGILTSLLVIFYLTTQKVPVGFLALGPLSGWIVNGITALFLADKLYKFKFQTPDMRYPVNILRSAWPISLTLFLNIIYFKADSFILSSFYSFREVGTYNLAYQIFANILVFPTFIMNSLYPLMVKTLSLSKATFIKQIKLAGIIFFIISTWVALFFWLGAPFIIKIISGQGFTGSSEALQILSLGLPAFFVSALLMWTMVTLGKYKAMAAVYATGLMVNLLLNFIFIPRYSFFAAAWVTGISEYLILTLQIIILLKDFKNSNK